MGFNRRPFNARPLNGGRVLSYRYAYLIFKGDHAGGPIDYTAAVASTPNLTYTGPALPSSSSTRFGVRAYDAILGLDDGNTDAAVLIPTGSTGQDLAGLPAAPVGLRALPRAGGSALVEWGFTLPSRRTLPTSFHVYAGTPSVSYAAPVATVAYNGTDSHRTTITGLVDGSTYAIAVRAVNATGEETNTATVSVKADATAPTNPPSLSLTVV